MPPPAPPNARVQGDTRVFATHLGRHLLGCRAEIIARFWGAIS